MSLRKETPCDFGECPYDAVYHTTCDWYCSEEEPEEDYEEWDEDNSDLERYEYEEDYDEPWDIECGFNPYMGCYDFDC